MQSLTDVTGVIKFRDSHDRLLGLLVGSAEEEEKARRQATSLTDPAHPATRTYLDLRRGKLQHHLSLTNGPAAPVHDTPHHSSVLGHIVSPQAKRCLAHVLSGTHASNIQLGRSIQRRLARRCLISARPTFFFLKCFQAINDVSSRRWWISAVVARQAGFTTDGSLVVCICSANLSCNLMVLGPPVVAFSCGNSSCGGSSKHGSEEQSTATACGNAYAGEER